MLKVEKETKSHLKSYHTIIFGFLVLSFFFDFVDKIELFYRIDFIKFNRYLKLIFLILALLFLISKFMYVIVEVKIIVLVFLSIFAMFLLKNNYTILYIDEFLRYSFPLLIFPLFHYVYFDTKIPLARHLYLFFKIFICLNAVVILIGLVLNLAIVQSYQVGRFGYNGLIISQGFTPYVYLCATTLFLIFKDKKMLGLILLLSIISGIKGVYFAEFLILSLFVLLNKSYTKKKKILASSIVLIGFLFFIISLFLSPIFKQVLANDGVLSMIFSYRNENLIEVFDMINVSNYSIFIGAITLEVVRVEMQLFDIIVFLGMIGLATYILFIYYLLKDIAQAMISIIYVIAAVTLSLLSGNLFYIPMAMVLMFLILFAFQKKPLIISNE